MTDDLSTTDGSQDSSAEPFSNEFMLVKLLIEYSNENQELRNLLHQEPQPIPPFPTIEDIDHFVQGDNLSNPPWNSIELWRKIYNCNIGVYPYHNGQTVRSVKYEFQKELRNRCDVITRICNLAHGTQHPFSCNTRGGKRRKSRKNKKSKKKSRKYRKKKSYIGVPQFNH